MSNRQRAVLARIASALEHLGRGARRLSRRIAPEPDLPAPNELRERWARWLHRSYQDVVILHDHQASWDELVDVVESNPHIPAPNHVMDFIRDLYGIVIAVGVRRQVDKSDDVANLRRLIDEVARRPDAITRDWFVNRYPEFLRDVGHTDFDAFAGAGGERVDSTIIRKDLAALGSTAAKVKRYVDQHLAHSADEPTVPSPTYGDLRACLAQLDVLLKRYYLLIDGGGLMSSTPTKQFNFRLPLLVPWAPDDRLLQHLRTTDPDCCAEDLVTSVRRAVAEGAAPSPEQVIGLLAQVDALRAEAHRRDV